MRFSGYFRDIKVYRAYFNSFEQPEWKWRGPTILLPPMVGLRHRYTLQYNLHNCSSLHIFFCVSQHIFFFLTTCILFLCFYNFFHPLSSYTQRCPFQGKCFFSMYHKNEVYPWTVTQACYLQCSYCLQSSCGSTQLGFTFLFKS